MSAVKCGGGVIAASRCVYLCRGLQKAASEEAAQGERTTQLHRLRCICKLGLHIEKPPLQNSCSHPLVLSQTRPRDTMTGGAGAREDKCWETAMAATGERRKERPWRSRGEEGRRDEREQTGQESGSIVMDARDCTKIHR